MAAESRLTFATYNIIVFVCLLVML